MFIWTTFQPNSVPNSKNILFNLLTLNFNFTVDIYSEAANTYSPYTQQVPGENQITLPVYLIGRSE